MSDSTTAVGAPAAGARIFAFNIAVCEAAGTPASGVGALATIVLGKVPGKMFAMIEPDPLAKGMFTETLATLCVAAPGVDALPRVSAKENAFEIVADELTAEPGATVETAMTRQTSSWSGSATAPTNRAPVKLKSAAVRVLQFTGSFAVKTKVKVRVVDDAVSGTNDKT